MSQDPSSKPGPMPLSPGQHLGLPRPEPYALREEQISQAIEGRREAFAPQWKPSRDDDPGRVLIHLFGGMAHEVGERIRGLPEKARIEHLRLAGHGPRPATPAVAMVTFKVAPNAPGPVVVPQGFQLSARPKSGNDLVIFETSRALLAAPGELAEVVSLGSSGLRNLTDSNKDPELSFQPFGPRPRGGDSLYLGLDGDGPPGTTLTLGFGVTSPPGAPPPASEGGTSPVPTRPRLLLSWEVLDGTRWIFVEPIRDETAQLGRSGIIELDLPARFDQGRPTELGDGPPLRWVRLRLVSNRVLEPLALDFVRVNTVHVSAGRTVHDEVLTPMPGAENRRFRLTQRPVLAGSLVLEVNAGDGFKPWREVEELSAHGPDDAVFTLDRQSGEVTFGDGVNGRELPSGFRHVRARAYRWGGGAAGAVEAGAIDSMLGSVAHLLGVTNPRPASGGDEGEPLTEAARRGPELLRAHGRAVLPSDYELLALSAPGARVRRVHAMPGRHPARPTTLLPGVVGLLVVPPEEEGPQSGPPLPDEQSLRSVARHVADTLAPAGVEIVAAAPAYHRVRIEAQVRLSAGVDQGAVLARLLESLDRYLHPLTGGENGEGWPFGGALRHDALLRFLLRNEEVLAVPRLSMVVDGRYVPPCQDREIGEHDLLWPDGHGLFPVEE